VLTVSAKNLTKEPLSFLAPIADAEGIFLENSAGQIVPTRDRGIKEDGLGVRWVTLEPGKSVDETLTLRFAADDIADPADAGENITLESNGVHYAIGKPGTFKISALLFRRPISPESRRVYKDVPEKTWSGRAVSPPVELKIAEPTKKNPEK
jgi:hypothetical protein